MQHLPTSSKPSTYGVACCALAAALAGCAQTGDVRRGDAALTTWRGDAPGVQRIIKMSDLPRAPTGTDPEASIGKPVNVVPPPAGALPRVPEGFAVQVFAYGLKQPRTVRVAPNGDVFVAEGQAGRVSVFRANAPGAPAEVFAENLEKPSGIAFHPAANPQHVYVGAANQVVRYPYRASGARPAAAPEVIVPGIPTERHWTRDIAVSPDGRRLFVAVGSASNAAAGMPDMTPAQIRAHEATHGRGATWGKEAQRGMVRVFDPEGRSVRTYATGLRNCSGMAMQPGTDRLWCAVNERDHLGPELVPDFIVQVREGGFYGWPWYYLGGKEDPAWQGKRPDLANEVQMPQVLFQAHSSAVNMVFYDGRSFPPEYRGDAFVALHGSHSRPERTGYKVIRVHMDGGQPTGVYEDFMTGFLIDNETAWGRPGGLAVMPDGSLLVSDDANGVIYRVVRR